MNINHVKLEYEENVKDVIPKIFSKQTELLVKYQDIEKLPNWPIDIDAMESQTIIKDFKQRILEELAEAFEAYVAKDEDHFFEELMDALHFATELMILIGIDSKEVFQIDGLNPSKLPNGWRYDIRLWDITYIYGLGMNCLKNKPWKQSQVLTDKPLFHKYMLEGYKKLLTFLLEAGMSSDLMYNYYCKKNEVNKFRQRSKY